MSHSALTLMIRGLTDATSLGLAALATLHPRPTTPGGHWSQEAKDLGELVLDCSKCGTIVHWVAGLGVSPGHWAHREPALHDEPVRLSPRVATLDPGGFSWRTYVCSTSTAALTGGRCMVRIREALRAEGMANVQPILVRVETQEDAERLHFTGSPTVLIDGRDPFGVAEDFYGLSCRVYDTPMVGPVHPRWSSFV